MIRFQNVRSGEVRRVGRYTSVEYSAHPGWMRVWTIPFTKTVIRRRCPR